MVCPPNPNISHQLVSTPHQCITGTRSLQGGLQQELAQMQARFPDAKPRDLKRFLMGHGMKADKAIPAYEAHLHWWVA